MQFICRVGTPDGRVLEQTFAASDEPALMTELGKLGYHVFEVRRRGLPQKARLSLRGRRRKAIPVQQFMVWNRELAALLKAGRNPTRQSLLAAVNAGLPQGVSVAPYAYSSTDHDGITGAYMAEVENGVLVPLGPVQVTDNTATGAVTTYSTTQPPAPTSGIP